MQDPQALYEKVLALLDQNSVEYKLFSHKEALTYEEIESVQKESGFFGREMKCMVLKGEDFFVYVTLQGNRVNMEAIKERVGAKKVRLALPEELAEQFGAKPGCAYPFGFDARFPIYVDPQIFEEEWLLFSPVLPTKTVQAKGADLKKLFEDLENKVEEVSNFNKAA